MSRVNYPKQRQIDRQIQAILKNSGMFEDDLTYNGFTELKPIQKKNDKIIRLLKTASSIAAIVSLIVLVDFMRKPVNTVQPLKNCESVLEDSQLKTTTKSYLINDSIEIEYVASSKNVEYKNDNSKRIQFEFNNQFYTDSVFSAQYDTSNCGRLECTYPTIKYNSQEKAEQLYIEEYYNSVIETLENNIRKEYLKGILMGANCYTTIYYHVQNIDSINEKLATFIAQEEVVSEYDNMTILYNNTYARTFDVQTGEPIELEKLFNEPEKSIDYIFDYLNNYNNNNSVENSGKEQSIGINGLGDLYSNEEGESNWYLTSEGIVFLINNMYYNSGAEGNTQILNSGSVLISYSDFYNQGFSFNSAYINYLPQ